MGPRRVAELPFTNSELDPILTEIKYLFADGFYYAAIAIALSVPDICSSLETRVDDELRRRVEQRYKGWCETYLQPKFGRFTAKDCWALRGGVLHNGKLHGHKQLGYERVMFATPGPISSHETIFKDTEESAPHTLTLDLMRFLQAMTEAAQEWHTAKRDEPIVQENIGGLVRMRLHGFPGSMVGWPVVA